jgi:5-methylthioadenosine/S-adenosylhomocysteine deaminase
MSPHSTYTLSIDDLVRCKNLADEYKLKTNIHLQESVAEVNQSIQQHGKRPLQRINEIGMVTPNLIAIHMTQIDDNDFAILKKNKPSLVHCPESNLKLVSGISPVEKLHQLGINVALGTDGAASNNDLDMIGEIRTAAFIGKITANDPKAVSAENVLKMATINGAKALGIDHETGSLTPGKSADFIAINLEQIETVPLYHPLSQIVYAASREQVTDVWVKGKQLLKNRQLQTLDEKELINKTQSWRNKIKN